MSETVQLLPDLHDLRTAQQEDAGVNAKPVLKLIEKPDIAATDIPPFHLNHYTLWSIHNSGLRPRHISEAAIYYLLQEEVDKKGSSFVSDAPAEDIPRSMLKAIALGQVCPVCSDTNSVPKPRHGSKTGIRVISPAPCLCVIPRSFWQHWGNPKKRR